MTKEEADAKIRKVYSFCRRKWKESQPSDRYPSALMRAEEYFSNRIPHRPDVIYYELWHLGKWIKNMEDYDWSEQAETK